jgi:hypothetical protein
MKARLNQFTTIRHQIFSLRIAELELQKKLKAVENAYLLVASNEPLRTRPRRLTALWSWLCGRSRGHKWRQSDGKSFVAKYVYSMLTLYQLPFGWW